MTDPPYGVAYTGGTRRALTIANDDLGEDGTRQLVAGALRAAPLRPGGAFYVFAPGGACTSRSSSRCATPASRSTRRSSGSRTGSSSGRADYHARHEPILYGWKPGAAHHFVADRTQDTVWECPRPARSAEHPTMKPVALVERAIRNSSRPGEAVYDPFVGSGTTLVAAEVAGRRGVRDGDRPGVRAGRPRALGHPHRAATDPRRARVETAMGRGRRPEAELAALRARIETLLLSGLRAPEIHRALTGPESPSPIVLSERQVRAHIAAVERGWAERADRATLEADRGRAIAQAEEAIRVATSRSALNARSNVGVGYLNAALKAQEQLARLRGLYAPTPDRAAGPGGAAARRSTVTLADHPAEHLDPAEEARRLRQLAADLEAEAAADARTAETMSRTLPRGAARRAAHDDAAFAEYVSDLVVPDHLREIEPVREPPPAGGRPRPAGLRARRRCYPPGGAPGSGSRGGASRLGILTRGRRRRREPLARRSAARRAPALRRGLPVGARRGRGTALARRRLDRPRASTSARTRPARR